MSDDMAAVPDCNDPSEDNSYTGQIARLRAELDKATRVISTYRETNEAIGKERDEAHATIDRLASEKSVAIKTVETILLAMEALAPTFDAVDTDNFGIQTIRKFVASIEKLTMGQFKYLGIAYHGSRAYLARVKELEAGKSHKARKGAAS